MESVQKDDGELGKEGTSTAAENGEKAEKIEETTEERNTAMTVENEEKTEKIEETTEEAEKKAEIEPEVENDVKEGEIASIINEEPAETCDPLPEMIMSDVRKAKSIASIASSDAGDLSALSDGDSSDFESIKSDPDSDVEFEQYLKETATRRHKNYIREHCWHMETKKNKRNPRSDQIDDEYENLPNFEKLTISCEESAKLAVFGSVQSVVGYIAMIKPDPGITHILDLDSVVFDKEGNSIGTIFDIVGTVQEALYCLRFGSKTEASEIPVGLQVFYAPTVEKFTKKLIDGNLKGPWKRAEVVEEEEDEAVFSDDEKEKEFRAKKNAKKAGEQGMNPGNARKRNNQNRSVHFAEPGADQGARGGRGRGNFRGGRGRGGGGVGRGGGFQWQQRSTMDTFRNENSPFNKAPVVPEAPKQARAPMSTPDNPYAEFGCYGSRS